MLPQKTTLILGKVLLVLHYHSYVGLCGRSTTCDSKQRGSSEQCCVVSGLTHVGIFRSWLSSNIRLSSTQKISNISGEKGQHRLSSVVKRRPGFCSLPAVAQVDESGKTSRSSSNTMRQWCSSFRSRCLKAIPAADAGSHNVVT